jgi:chromosomal replication initiation ATPase DnaA
MGYVRALEHPQNAYVVRFASSDRFDPVAQVVDPVVAAVFDVPLCDLRATTRGSQRTAFARQVAMYLTHVVLGLSLTQVGSSFARDRTTVAHACAMIEDMRDDPVLDARLDHLERAICSLVDALFARRG